MRQTVWAFRGHDSARIVRVSSYGTAENGLLVFSDVCFYHISAGAFNQTKKKVVLK